jgi:hypothetical protein
MKIGDLVKRRCWATKDPMLGLVVSINALDTLPNMCKVMWETGERQIQFIEDLELIK